MNKSIKTLLELNGMMLGAKVAVSLIPSVVFLGIAVPGYVIAAGTLLVETSILSSYKISKSKNKENPEMLSKSDLFYLED